MADDKEKKAFEELKKRMEGYMESDLYEDDNVFYRFLRARDVKVDAAEAMLREHLIWRKNYDVTNILEFQVPEVLKNYFPLNFVGHTKEGHVLRYVPTGNLDCRGLLACCTVEEWAKHFIKYFEEDLVRLKKQSKMMGKLVDKIVYVHDFKEMTLAKATDKKVILQLIAFTNMYLDNYPETLKALYLINAPSYFSLLYSVLKAFLPSQFIKKISMYTDDSWRKDLLEIMDAEILPEFLGGKRTDPDGNPLCNTFINHGGLIPKRYYNRNKQSFATSPDVQKINVHRAAVHETCLEVKKPGSHLVWEIQLKSGDIKFGIMYQDDKGEKTVVVPFQRIISDEYTETGIYKCENVGTYITVFDNSYNFFKSKDIFCKMQVMSSRNDTGSLDE